MINIILRSLFKSVHHALLDWLGDKSGLGWLGSLLNWDWILFDFVGLREVSGGGVISTLSALSLRLLNILAKIGDSNVILISLYLILSDLLAHLERI